MQVILLERVSKLGQMGDVVDVKPGYARNFLLPQGKAQTASETNITAFEKQKSQLETKNLETKKEVAEKIAGAPGTKDWGKMGIKLAAFFTTEIPVSYTHLTLPTKRIV